MIFFYSKYFTILLLIFRTICLYLLLWFCYRFTPRIPPIPPPRIPKTIIISELDSNEKFIFIKLEKIYIISIYIIPNITPHTIPFFFIFLLTKNPPNSILIAEIKITDGFIIFSLVCSIVYIINDIKDREKDKLHEKKKDRPIASGRVGIREALILILILSISIIVGLMYIKPKYIHLV